MVDRCLHGNLLHEVFCLTYFLTVRGTVDGC
jgi:hypothetical protein